MDDDATDLEIGAREPQALSVAQLTARIKDLLETNLPPTWVAGEVSNLSRPSSGHCYFTLKDELAQIRAVMWRGTATKLRFDLTDGMELLCFGRLDVYPPRGSYQLVVSQAEPRGVGALELAFRQLRDKLSAEGLFAIERKRPLPRFPRRVAFVTSPTGAAIRDFLEVLRRRWAGVDVLIVPARVQGDGAANEIAAGIRAASRLANPPQVIVVGRGGGSLEDLWCFNEEAVVRAIAASTIPVISAVGHEIDVTLADLVADRRALTPSEAAELVAPAAAELQQSLTQWRSRIETNTRNLLARNRQRLERLAEYRVFMRPQILIEDRQRGVDELELRAGRAIKTCYTKAGQEFAEVAAKLEALSPLSVLGRGYSVTTSRNGRIIRDACDVRAGDELTTRVARGKIDSRVIEVREA